MRGFAVHGACYCRDCQAFARFLGRPERMLDAQAGTEVIGTLPHRLRITSGQERLACITLDAARPTALVCRVLPHAAIGNGARSPKTPFVTVQRRVLAVPQAESSAPSA